MTTIPFTIDISISSSNSYSTIYSPMSEPHTRKIYENITYLKQEIIPSHRTNIQH